MVPKRKMPRIAYFWPGLPQLWLRGSWAHFAIAVGFTALVNVLILATFVFRWWLPLEQLLAGYGVVAGCWLLGWIQSRRHAFVAHNSEEPAAKTSTVGQTNELREQLYRDAQRVYLQGDWVAAEQMLLKLLKIDYRDAEARLMLATLWRHQRRHREALRQLDKLSRLEVADPWINEIAAERQENAAALALNSENISTPESTEQDNEPESEIGTLKIGGTEPSMTETDETKRRWAA